MGGFAVQNVGIKIYIVGPDQCADFRVYPHLAEEFNVFKRFENATTPNDSVLEI